MNKNSWNPKGRGPDLSRRKFISVCGSCAALCAVPPLDGIKPVRSIVTNKRKTIRVVYSLHAVKQPRPDWPNVGFDFAPVMRRINGTLEGECPEFDFVPTMASGPQEAEKILEQDRSASIDGYIVFQMNCWNKVIQTMAKSGKPVLYADFQYGGSGGFLVYTAGFLREQASRVGFVASSRMDDLVKAVKCFGTIDAADEFAAATTRLRIQNTRRAGDPACKTDRLEALSCGECLSRMKQSRILAVRDQNSGPLEPIMEIPVEAVSFAEVNAAWEKADRDESRAVAGRWRKAASDVIDVPLETLESSAAFYLGMKDVLKKHAANAITVNCLGGFYGGHIHAYPCLGFHELNNEGLVGACECDTRSTATMLAFSTLTRGRPGYISDPIIDTAKRQIVYAHCVASNKVFGPDGRTNPFAIMTHSEDRQGASIRSFLPLGYMTTTLEILPDQKEILFHQGKAVDNDPDDRACRTKLCVEPVGDMEKLFTMWDRWGWHRVTFYGDLKEPVYSLADHMGWRVIEEA